MVNKLRKLIESSQLKIYNYLINGTNVELWYDFNELTYVLNVDGKRTHIKQYRLCQLFNMPPRLCEPVRLALIDKFSKYLN